MRLNVGSGEGGGIAILLFPLVIMGSGCAHLVKGLKHSDDGEVLMGKLMISIPLALYLCCCFCAFACAIHDAREKKNESKFKSNRYGTFYTPLEGEEKASRDVESQGVAMSPSAQRPQR